MTNANTAVAKAKEAAATAKAPVRIEDLIQQSAKQLQMALPSHMRPERIVRIALTTLRMTPKLYECNIHSFLAALFQAAQLGLEPNVLGEAYIIPYNVRGQLMAQFQVGYMGLIKLFWNHQNAASLQVETVYKNDRFEYDLGENHVHHVPPVFGEDRGPVIGYYAVAHLQGGGRAVKVMSKEEVLQFARKFSKCWDSSKNEFIFGTPWREHFDAMAMKTVLKRLMKLLPKSIEIQRALIMDETVKVLDPNAKAPETDLALLQTVPGTFSNGEGTPHEEKPALPQPGGKKTVSEVKIHEAKRTLKTLTKSDEAYYTILGANGYEHSSEIKLDIDRQKVLGEFEAKIQEVTPREPGAEG